MSLEEFKDTYKYKEFINLNPAFGRLKVRAYTASEAIPVRGLDVKITKIIDGVNVVFFEGKTDSSGVIENILLPAPKLDNAENQVPPSIEYNLTASYDEKFKPVVYKVIIYDNIYVIQNINVLPEANLEEQIWL